MRLQLASAPVGWTGVCTTGRCSGLGSRAPGFCADGAARPPDGEYAPAGYSTCRRAASEDTHSQGWRLLPCCGCAGLLAATVKVAVEVRRAAAEFLVFAMAGPLRR